MALIDQTYFIGDINLPAKTYGNMNSFIAKFEKEFLIKIFGYGLYKLIAAYNPENTGVTQQRIRDIIEGKDYMIGSYTYRWNGLINADKVSPIAYYVYINYMRDQVSKTTTTGEVKDVHENAIRVETSQKIQKASYSMQKLLGELYYSDHEYYSSLHFFMMNNYVDYPEYQYMPMGSTNAFDL
jgi:hypothetical protein